MGIHLIEGSRLEQVEKLAVLGTVRAYPDGQHNRLLDTSRAKDRFGWEARVGLGEGLAQPFAWMRQILQPS